MKVVNDIYYGDNILKITLKELAMEFFMWNEVTPFGLVVCPEGHYSTRYLGVKLQEWFEWHQPRGDQEWHMFTKPKVEGGLTNYMVDLTFIQHTYMI